MEKKFEKIVNFAKAFESHQLDVSKSFEFDLFRESSWFFAMNEWDQGVQIETLREANIAIENNLAELTVTEPKRIRDRNPESKIKILFIGDTFNNDGEDLLYKMIIAMKLEEREYFRLPLDPQLDEILDLEANLINPHPSFETLRGIIAEKSPEFVISLGATVTNIILGRREKMSAIHGKFFDSTANNWKFKLMPIFHPDFLIINPNMKRTTWIDLQKIMVYFGQN